MPGGTFFFTVVTHERKRILTDATSRSYLRHAFRDVRARHPFEIVAMVLLPDHLHSVWKLPPGDSDFSTRWSQIKQIFTHRYLCAGGQEAIVSSSRSGRRERSIWQRRFWEHTCRDEDDLKRCIDYLHWNPVKHGLARSVRDYPWSTFHRFVREGEYDPDWGRDVAFPGRMSDGWE